MGWDTMPPMMSLTSHTFWIDYESGKLLESFTSGAEAKDPVFVQGDTGKVEIHLLRRNGSIREEIGLPAGATLKMGIGRLETAPTGGSFRLGYKGVASAEIAYNADATAIQSALNGIPAVASEGGISVAVAGDAFLLSWISGTTHDPITSDPDGLFPTSQIVLVGQVAGDIQKVLLHLQQSPVAFLQTFTSMGEPELSSELIATIGSKKVYRISISPNPAGGSFYISGTNTIGTLESGAISVNATSADVLNALPSTISPDASVSKSGLYSWDISIASANSLTADGSGIIGWVGVEGFLSLNTVQIHEFLNARETAPALLEFVLSESTGETTILQADCSIVADLIDEGSLAPLDLTPPLSEGVANNRYIRKDIASAPSDATQDIIWQNLGLTIDGSTVVDAIDGASSPSGGNPFATLDDLDGLATESFVTSQGYLTSSALAPYALLSGATFSGQVNIGSMATNAPRTEIQTSSIGATISMTKSASQQAVLSLGEALDNKPFLFLSGVSGSVSIHSGKFFSGGLFDEVEPYARVDGATFSGKANFTSVSGAAGLNIGIGGTSTSASVAGDLWISSGGASLNFRDGTGAWRILAATSNTNSFSAPQIIDTTATTPALRVTQKGTGEAIRVEDSTSPDSTSFIVTTDGRVGVGINTGASIPAGYSMHINGSLSSSEVQVLGNILFGSIGSEKTFKIDYDPQSNPFSSGSFSSSDYPQEIFLTIGGNRYAIPARMF